MSGAFGFRIPVATMTDAIAALRTIVDEAKLRFDDDGFQSRAVDAANVAMADVAISDAAFKRLNVGDDETTLGINLTADCQPPTSFRITSGLRASTTERFGSAPMGTPTPSIWQLMIR